MSVKKTWPSPASGISTHILVAVPSSAASLFLLWNAQGGTNSRHSASDGFGSDMEVAELCVTPDLQDVLSETGASYE